MTGKLAISVVIPVRNEEANLAECLQRLGSFGEVVVVDSGSSDATCRIASDFGARTVQFEWNGSYPKKRNWVLLNVDLANDWVLFVDADELVTGQFCSEVEHAIREGGCNGYWLNYTNHFQGRPLRHGDPQRKLALFRKGAGLYERIEEDHWSHLDMEIHEHPIIEGRVGEIRAPVEHRDDRGIARFLERHREYALWEARRTLELRGSEQQAWHRLTIRQRRKYANIDKWWFAWTYFAWTYVLKRGFLDGAPGFSYAFCKLWYFWTIRLLIREARA